MAGSLPTSEEELPLLSDINVTPFVDVVLVLLVIFIITAPIIAKSSLLIKLPRASTKDATPPESLGVVVTREGQILLDGKVVDESTFIATISDRVKQQPNLQGIVSADEEARHRDVVHAIDLMKGAGLQRFGLEVESARGSH